MIADRKEECDKAYAHLGRAIRRSDSDPEQWLDRAMMYDTNEREDVRLAAATVLRKPIRSVGDAAVDAMIYMARLPHNIERMLQSGRST